MDINDVPDTACLFQAAALFSVTCYPLRGTNVFKIQNSLQILDVRSTEFKYNYKIH